MQGSVDNPPIIVQSSRARAVWQLSLSGCLAGWGLYQWLSTSQTPSAAAAMVTGLAALMLAYAAQKLIKPDVLELSPKGLHYKIAWRNRRFHWNEIGIFREDRRPYGWPRLKTVVFSCNPDDPDKFYRVELGNQWEIDNKSLVEILDRAHARWVGAGGRATSPPDASLTRCDTPYLQSRNPY